MTVALCSARKSAAGMDCRELWLTLNAVSLARSEAVTVETCAPLL